MKLALSVLAVLTIVSAFVGTVLFLYQQSVPHVEPYRTVHAVRRTIVDETLATGSIVPRKEIAIKSQVRGVVEKFFSKPGDLVKAGDLLARIKVIADPLEVNRAEHELSAAKLKLQQAAEDLEFTENAFKRKAVSDLELSRKRLACDVAGEEVKNAQANLELIQVGVAKSTAHTATRVTATIDGMVLNRAVEEGDFVIESNPFNEGTTIVSIADMSNLLFKGKVEEAQAGRLTTNMPLEIEIGALEGETFNATLEFISPKAETDEGSVKFEIHAALHVNTDRMVRAGYSATARIEFARRENVLAILERDLVFEDDQIFADIEVGPDKFERRKLDTGISDGLYIEVRAGLDEQDKIKTAAIPATPATP